MEDKIVHRDLLYKIVGPAIQVRKDLAGIRRSWLRLGFTPSSF